MTGLDKARAVADQIKKRAADEAPAVIDIKTDKTLAAIRDNKELMDMYNESASMGAENLGGKMPTLKVHVANKSVNNLLMDGSEPNDGWFFHTTTQQQFKNVECHILTISRSFYAEGMTDNKTGIKGDDKMNQILGGLVINDGVCVPFIMYFTGLKLSRLWDFAKDVSKYTHAVPVSIPMFALTVRLSTEKITHANSDQYGKATVVNFELVRNEDSSPVLISDKTEFAYIRDQVAEMTRMITLLVEKKATEKKADTAVVDDGGYAGDVESVSEITYPDAIPAETETSEKDVVVPEDMPF